MTEHKPQDLPGDCDGNTDVQTPEMFDAERRSRPFDHWINSCILTLVFTMMYDVEQSRIPVTLGREQSGLPTVSQDGPDSGLANILYNLDQWRTRNFEATPLPECRKR